ncbi:DUF5696 domain-containing protein [Paenibacillus sp. J5C_2022]|uniref:DUF5696 domain-containing protein n=1 Tax=Paenibacillus sp. J5C2022 TaxID=2977129 RepID=UPI0021CF10AC|nr:DUF5696 domain-containing protein [Paenibacillus sp. J5C2022]MCU6712645.1 DUF5696 domain-containing protein [Paenibacillus sp. J5C2022]
MRGRKKRLYIMAACLASICLGGTALLSGAADNDGVPAASGYVGPKAEYIAGQKPGAGQDAAPAAAAALQVLSSNAAYAAAPIPPGFQAAAENEHLLLLFHPGTTEVVVREKATGREWATNPLDRDKDGIATAMNRTDLDSQLIVSYYNDRGHLSYMNNATESVQKKQFEIVQEDEGLTVTYEIGSSEKGMSAVPKVVSKERFEERILGRIEDEQARNRLRTRFFYNEEKEQYERKDMQDYIVKDVVALLESIGYTAEEAKQDNAAAADAPELEELAPRFTIPIRYELRDSSLYVAVDTTAVTDTEAFPLHQIQLLPFFAAAGMEEEGYMLVPDGSGALIGLNDTNKGARAYEVPLYGKDGTPKREEGVVLQSVAVSRLPVFGMKRGEHAMLAIIEQGDAQATITADTSGKLNSYNRVGASFRVREMEPVEFRAGSMTRRVPKFSELYDDGIGISYRFLTGKDANYVGMAAAYRQELIDRFQVERLQSGADMPFVLELIGAVSVRDTFLGIPYDAVEPMTTYAEAVDILDRLQREGVYNIQLKYAGWFNEGYRHTLPRTIRLDSELGGRAEFRRLLEYVEERHVALYPDVAFLQVYDRGDGFRPSRDAARFLNRKAILSFARDPVTTNPEDREYYLLSPRKLTGVVNDFLNQYATYGGKGLSLRDLGNELHSEVDGRGATTDRQDAMAAAVDNLKRIADEVNGVMVDGGNAYAIPYADTIVNAPLSSSKFNIAREEIPFYSIVLHGYVDLAGMPLNHGQDQDARDALLRTLETGSLLYYQWMHDNPSAIRDTKLNAMYASDYTHWLDEAVQLYGESNRILKQVRHQTIADHRKLDENVYMTTYEEGLSIVVNYNESPVSVEGLTIEGKDYRVIGGGER